MSAVDAVHGRERPTRVILELNAEAPTSCTDPGEAGTLRGNASWAYYHDGTQWRRFPDLFKLWDFAKLNQDDALATWRAGWCQQTEAVKRWSPLDFYPANA